MGRTKETADGHFHVFRADRDGDMAVAYHRDPYPFGSRSTAHRNAQPGSMVLRCMGLDCVGQQELEDKAGRAAYNRITMLALATGGGGDMETLQAQFDRFLSEERDRLGISPELMPCQANNT